MHKITIRLEEEDEIWALFDQSLAHIFVADFCPEEAARWDLAQIQIGRHPLLQDIMVRHLRFDVHTDLEGLQKLLAFGTRHLRVYQSKQPISQSLEPKYLKAASREKILAQNGIRHFFFLSYEFVEVESFDAAFIAGLEARFNCI